MPNFLNLNSIMLAISLFVLSACGNQATPVEDIIPIAVATVPAVTATLPPATPLTTAPPAATPLAAAEVPATSPAPATNDAPAITFNLSGGIIGFCDELTISPAGGYTLRTCQQPNEISGNLIPSDVEALNQWRKNLADFSLNQEDNSGGADNLTSRLVFKGQGATQADETQQGLILDWVNRLLAQIRPQSVPSPTPEPVVIGPEGLCPDIARPAILVINFQRQGGLTLVDPNSQAACDIQLKQPPYGRIVTSAGNIYYPLYDEAAKTVTIWQLSPKGEQTPLAFTGVSMEQFGPYSFTISGDGNKIAWVRAVPNFEQDPPLYRNDLWVANLDGSGQVTLLDQAEYEQRYVEPVRFAPDNSTLYYALQPDGLGGGMFSFGGRYDSMVSLPTTGGEPHLIFACPEGENMMCIGDIAPTGSALAYVQPGQGVVVLGSDGALLATLTPPATDYIGSPVFGPTGNLAFVSVTLTEAGEQTLPQPNPGAISLVAPPYTGELKTLVSDKTVTAAWEWLDENRLIYGALDPESGNIGTAIVTLDGQSTKLSSNFALAVLR